MMRYTNVILCLCLIIIPNYFTLFTNDGLLQVSAGGGGQDPLEGEDVEVETVDEEADTDTGATPPDGATQTGETQNEELNSILLLPSSDVLATLLFTHHNPQDLPAGELVKCLIGFRNTGDKDFVIESVQSSIRYPQDFSYHIQNFTTFTYNRVVTPGNEVTLAYAFKPSDMLGGRPFGLVIDVTYSDEDGSPFGQSVFNDTVSFVEMDSAFDAETFFLYIFIAAVCILIGVGTHHYFTGYGKKHGGKKRKFVETGTSKSQDFDPDWIPKETLLAYKNGKKNTTSPRPGSKSPKKSTDKSPKKSPKSSPKTSPGRVRKQRPKSD